MQIAELFQHHFEDVRGELLGDPVRRCELSLRLPAVAACFCKARYYWNAETLCLRAQLQPRDLRRRQTCPNPTPTTCVCSAGTVWNNS
jgi:hypothetical protein